MADLSVTAASVAYSSGERETGTAGETVTAGMAVYKSSSDGLLYKADCNASGKDATYGIALHDSIVNRVLTIQKSGYITIGATVAVGTVYVQSGTAGGICPWADLVTSDKLTVIGYGYSTTQLLLQLNATGIAHA